MIYRNRSQRKAAAAKGGPLKWLALRLMAYNSARSVIVVLVCSGRLANYGREQLLW
jgi:hypothetical protein